MAPDPLKIKSAKQVYKNVTKVNVKEEKINARKIKKKFKTELETLSKNFSKEEPLCESQGLLPNKAEDHTFIPYLPIKNLKILQDSRVLGRKTFEWLIYPITINTFFKEIWEKKPLLIKRHQFSYYNNLFSSAKFDEILRKEFLNFTENIDLTTYNDGVKELHNPVGRAYAPIVWDYYQEGCSVRFLNPQSYDHHVWQLNSQLQEFFSSLVGANAYLTPPGTQGFAPHYDDIDAFVLQLEGRKRWKVYGKDVLVHQGDHGSRGVVTCDMPLASSPNFLEGRDFRGGQEPLLQTVLGPGDLLYMPRGYIHQATTLVPTKHTDAEETPKTKKQRVDNVAEGGPNHPHSLHITLSTCQNNTWSKVMERAFSLALSNMIETEVEFRKSLPPGYLQYMGLPYRENEGIESETSDLNLGQTPLSFYAYGKDGDYSTQTRTLSRVAFVSHFKKLCESCFENISPDMAVDSLSKDLYLREALPPSLTRAEKCLSIFSPEPNFGQSAPRFSSSYFQKGEVESMVKLTPKTKIKILRHGCFRVICNPGVSSEEEKIAIYHCLENGRIYEEREIQYFNILPEVLPCIEHLINTYPKYIHISSLPMSSTEEKVDVATSLFEKGILIVSPKSCKKTSTA